MRHIVLIGLVVAAGLAVSRADDKAAKANGHRVFELRTYYIKEGKLDDLNRRFRDHTCDLLKRHGAEMIGFWTPTDKEGGKGAKLVYMLAFPSREAANKCWGEFGKDPEWQKVRAESEKDGKLVDHVDRVFLEPTDYSEMK